MLLTELCCPLSPLNSTMLCHYMILIELFGPLYALNQGCHASADLRKSAAERFASADGKTSAADWFICGFGQNLEDFDYQTKKYEAAGGKRGRKEEFDKFG